MVRDRLDSTRVNYLIYRYLLESNFRETALSLQKEWKVEKSTVAELSPHVRQHTLVYLLQRGLIFDQLEREVTAKETGLEATHGFFGPLTGVKAVTPVAVEEEQQPEDVFPEKIASRTITTRPYEERHESPAKRAKLSNGFENGFDSNAMEIDDHGNGNVPGHAYPSPQEVERPPTPIITRGPERGTQVEKVIELTSETVFLSLSDTSLPANSLILQCEWHPQDATILATAGSDPLVRLWTISRTPASSEPGTHVNTALSPSFNLKEASAAPHTSVTALSWSADGQTLASATEAERDENARVVLWHASGDHRHTFTGFEPPIISLQWNPTSELILAVMPEKGGSAIAVFSVVTGMTVSFSISKHNLIETPLEVVWVGDNDFLVCGGEILWAVQFSDDVITLSKKYETRVDHGLTQIAYDSHTRLFATASESGIIDIWDAQDKRHSISAHQNGIVSLMWQPISNHSIIDETSERLLASSGEDGIISVWNARAEGKAKCSMTMESAVVALAFTPDGAFLAGATSQQVLIWRVEDVSVPRARWNSGADTERISALQEEDHHCLVWDADGQKLAYAVNSQMSVIRWLTPGDAMEH